MLIMDRNRSGIKPTEVNTCRLDSGEVRSYDMCNSNIDETPRYEKFDFIGDGVIDTIDGVSQHESKTRYSFFVKNAKFSQ